jgi:hypothetical protein
VTAETEWNAIADRYGIGTISGAGDFVPEPTLDVLKIQVHAGYESAAGGKRKALSGDSLFDCRWRYSPWVNGS